MTKTASKPTRIKNTNKGTAVFRTSSHESTGKIKDINLSEILLYLPREESIPALFDQVVVDIQIPEQKEDVARINGFVCSVAAPDKLETTDKIMVGVKYVDADPEKMAVLSRFIAHIR